MQTVRINVDIYVETDDPEGAAYTLNSGLEGQLAGFPDGEIIGVNVTEARPATHEELDEHGFVE